MSGNGQGRRSRGAVKGSALPQKADQPLLQSMIFSARFRRGGSEDSCVLSRPFCRCCEVSATRGLVHAWIGRRASMDLRNCHNFHDFRRLAKRRVPGPIFDYIDGAADEETTHRHNTEAFESCDLVPSVLRGVGSVDLSVTVMGQKLALPVYALPLPCSACSTIRVNVPSR